jgi:DNA-binding transcriptional regulator YiaG
LKQKPPLTPEQEAQWKALARHVVAQNWYAERIEEFIRALPAPERPAFIEPGSKEDVDDYWCRLVAFASVDLGISEERLWNMVPQELWTLIDRYQCYSRREQEQGQHRNDLPVGQRLRVLREARGLTIDALAADPKLNYSRDAILAWEAGRRRPSTKARKALADYYGLSVSDLK